MKRNTKEFQDIQKEFEKQVDSGAFGYIVSDFTKETANKNTFYSNGQVNQAFKAFIAGYAMGRCEYLN